MANMHVNLAFSADTGKAKAQIQELQTLLSKIAYTGTSSNNLTDKLQSDIKAASAAAKDLQFHLNNAFNTTTGKFDLSLLDKSLKTSGANITDLSTKLLGAGTTGQQAFMKLAQSISLADQPMFRISKRMQDFAVTMKNTVKWQLSSSMLHGFMGAVQSAYGYAQDLNKSLTDIRIVTGYNTNQMAQFAEQANKAAKALSTTTTDYTNASLIYFQQGLTDQEVQERTDITIKMANAAGQSAQVVSDQMTAVWNNFYDGSKSLEYYADVMTALGAATASSTDEISQGLSKFAAVAETVGLSYEYATAALATITSNTRESADVVGNALKTLFARIQGLKLGETLEDGVDLNKYSEALDKVGISIFEQNGSLKDMDNILTEMAAKWGTLSDTQQVALAQTVAGVRQYTQLIALMENWDSGDADSFMANLGTIESAEGTLDEQASIYAESWEAAQKRVEAAAQGIYQSLLDDDFFIALSNGFADLLGGLDAFIDNAGGVKTVLLGIGSTVLTVFANQIPKALDTLKYNLSILTKGSNEAYKTIQSQMQAATEKAFTQYQEASGNKGIQENSAMGFAIKQANQLTEARNRLTAVSDKMSDADRQAANVTLSLIQAHQDETIALKQKNEAMSQSITQALESMKVVNAEGLNDYNIDRGLKASSALKKHEDDDYNIGLMPEDIEGLSGVAIDLGQTINEQIIQKLEDAGVAAKGLKDDFSDTINVIRNSDDSLTEFGQLINKVDNRLEQLSSGSYDINDSQFSKIKQQAQDFIDILPPGIVKIGEVKKALNALNSAKDITELSSAWKELDKVLLKIQLNAKNAGEALEGTGNTSSINAVNNNMRNLYTNTQKANEQTTILERLYTEFDPKQTIRMSEAMGALGGMVGNAITIFNSLKSTIDTLSDADTTGMEKFMAVLSAIAFTTPATIGLISDYVKVVKFLKQEYAKASVAATAATAANANYGQMIHNMNQAIQKMNLNLSKKARALNEEEKVTMKAAMAAVLKGEIEEKVAAEELKNILIKKGIPPVEAKAMAAELVHNEVRGASVKVILSQMAAQLGLNAAMLPYIAILAAVGIGIGLLANHIKKQTEETRENAKIAREAAAVSREQVDSNQKLVDSYLDTLNVYNEVKEAFSKGQATSEELANAQDSLAESAYEVAKALGVEGAALAKLSGNYNQLTKDIVKVQNNNIQETIEKEQEAKSLTGEEFITDMREGKGHFTIDQGYSARMGSGMDNLDEKFFSNADYSDYKHLSQVGGEVLINTQDQSIDSLMTAYEEAQDLYNQALKTMSAEEMNKSEVFQNLKNWLNKSKDSYEAYKASEKNIQKYNIQSASFSTYGNVKSAYDISSIEDYDSYYSNMVKSLAKAEGIEEGTQAWEELDKAVQAYLGSLSGVSKFATEAKAFDEIAEKTGLARNELIKYYNELETEEEKELFFKIAFNRADSISELDEEMSLLQSVADGQSIQVKLEVVSAGIDLLSDDATTEEIIAWAKKMQDAYGDAFNLEEFLAKSSNNQLDYLQDLQTQAKFDKSANREGQILEYQSAIQRAQSSMSEQENAYKEESDDKIKNQVRLNELEKYKADYNKAISEGQSFDFSSINEEGITNVDQLNNAITATEELIAANDKIIGSYNELESQVKDYEQSIKDLEIEKQVENAYGWRDALKEEAEALDISYDEVQDYAEQLRENHEELKNNIKLSEEIALAEKKQAKGADDLIDNYKDYAKVLKKAKLDGKIKDTEEYTKAIKNLRKDLSLLTGYEEEIFTDEFINSDAVQKALSDISKGVDGATEKLKVLATAQEIKIKAGIEVDDTTINNLWTEIANLNNQNIEVGATIDEAPALDSLVNLLQQAGYTTSQIQDLFNNLGWQPEVGYEEVQVKDLSTHESNGYVEVVEGNPYEGYTVVSKPVSAFSGMDQEEWVKVPKIGSKSAGGGGYKKVDPIGNSSSKKPSSGGGGGGGSTPKHAEKKSTSEKTRYHTLQNQLEDLTSEYDALADASDRAFGQEKLDNIDAEIKKTDELIKKQEEYLQAIQSDLPVDKSVMTAYYNETIGGPTIQFDENGNISNYDQIQDAMFNKYNAMTAYDEDSLEWQTFEKKYEQLEKYIEQYEETYDLLREEEASYQDLLNQRIDLELEKVQYKVEIQLEVPESQFEVVEYQLGRIEDDIDKTAESIVLLTQQAELLYDQIQVNKQGINEALQLSLSTAEINELMAGNMDVLNGKSFTEDQIDAIKDYRDNLLDLNEEFDDLREQVEETIMNAFDELHDAMDEGIDQFDHYNSMLESYKSMIETVGKDTLGVSNSLINTLSQITVENAINQVEATQDAYKALQQTQVEAEEALEKAKARGDEQSIAFWEDTLNEIQNRAEEAQEEMMSAWEEALTKIAEQFEAAVQTAVDAFNEAVYQLGGIEALSSEFDRQKEMADMYLDDYQKIYELSKLNRDINNSIDDTDSLAGKQKLKKLLGEINKLQAEGVKMSQYDLEYLQAEYDLRMAEIALEEVQRAKDTVRLQRDNEGNWSYVYTQNTEAVDEAQQKYEDALYAMQDLSSNYIDEISAQLIETSQEMQEALAAIRIEDYASIEEYYEEVERVQEQYQEQLAMQEEELNKAVTNNKELYDTDWTNYHNATGYKISDTEAFATKFSDTLLGVLTNSESDTSNFTNILTDATDALMNELYIAAEQYYTNMANAMKAAGTSTGEFADDLATNVEQIKKDSKEAAIAVEDMAENMQQQMDNIMNKVAEWQRTYGEAMNEIINANLSVIESFNEMLATLSMDDSKVTVTYDIQNSNQDILDADQFDTGGYTGKWGGSGKYAVLHEKELVLNKTDTENMFKALKISREMLSTIELNARQASLGLGAMVPATIRDDVKETLEQVVTITAEFPNATDHNEIEEAFNTLINRASQYANRK